MNKNIPMRLGVHGGHIQPRYYSSEGEQKDNLYFLFNDMAAILNFLTSLRLCIIYT